MAGGAWTRAQIETERRFVDLLTAGVTGGPDAALHLCLESALEKGDGSMVRRLQFVMGALRIHVAHGGLTGAQIGKLVELGVSLLRLAHVKPTTSKVSFVWGELYELLGRVYAREGRTVEALWEYHVAQYLSRKAPVATKARQLVVTAGHSLRLGHARLALQQLALAAADGLEGEDADLADLARGEAHWLLADAAAAEAAEAQLRARLAPGAAAGDELLWRAAVRDAACGGDPAALTAAAAAAPVFRLQTLLWGYARPDGGGKQIRAKDHPRDEVRDDALLRCAQGIEQCYDTVRPLDQRLRTAQRLLADATRTSTVLRQLLAVAAAARWLARFNQVELATVAVAEYRALCFRVSEGRTDDHLKLLVDLDPEDMLRRYRKGGGADGANPDDELPAADSGEAA